MIKCKHHICNACNTPNYEIEDILFLYRFLAIHNNSVFIDVGAHVGLYVRTINRLLYENEKYYGTCSMVSIEPDINVLQALYHNTTPHTVLNMAAWGEQSGLWLRKNGRAHGQMVCKDVNGSIPALGMPIDTIYEWYLSHDANVLAMKIDVEGSESMVVDGAHNTLRAYKHGALVIELSKSHLAGYGCHVEDVVTPLAECGYVPVDVQQLEEVDAGLMRNVRFIKEDNI